jgi:hypothetical protein
LLAYAAVVAAVGGWSCFSRLGGGMLLGDEAYFAFTTEHMRATGDYVVPSIGRPHPHLNAAPLYNWLSCLTADRIADPNVRHRVWSAAFGVGCGVAALLLGAVLFSAEVGLLAGLLLVTNHQFLCEAGARTGTMNSALACFVTLAAVCYAKSRGSGVWWVGVGICIGLAALAKPPVMAGFFGSALAAHHLVARRDLPWKRRMLGPLGGAAVAIAVALPWYAALYLRLGPESLERLFIYNSLRRASAAVYAGAGQSPWWYYAGSVWESSFAFKLAAPALAFGIACAPLGRRRFAWGLLVFLAGAFLAAVSLSAEKHTWYAFPVFPLLAVTVAAALLSALDRVTWRVIAVCVAGFVLVRDVAAVRAELRTPRLGYPPLLVHRAAESDLAAGRVRLVLFDFPRGVGVLDRELGFVPADRTYGFHLPHAVVVRTVPELDALLADGTPTALFLPPNLHACRLAERGLTHAPEACIGVQSDCHAYPLATFHGGAAAFRVGEVLGGRFVLTGEPTR